MLSASVCHRSQIDIVSCGMQVLPRYISPTRAVLEGIARQGGLSSEQLSELFGINSKSSYKLMMGLTTNFGVSLPYHVAIVAICTCFRVVSLS